MVTETNARLNLKTAAANVRARMGLGADSTAWTYEQRTEYNHALAAEILKYPNSFTPEILAIASRIANTVYTDLDDATLDWAQFAGEVGGNALSLAQVAAWVSILVGVIVIAKELRK